MAVIDLMSIVDQRLEDITKQNHSMTVEEYYFGGETGLWCLITIRGSEGRTLEHDFIESTDSWKRADVAADYTQSALEKVRVVVIVPDLALPDVLLLVRDYGAEGVQVTDYTAMGLLPLPLIR